MSGDGVEAPGPGPRRPQRAPSESLVTYNRLYEWALLPEPPAPRKADNHGALYATCMRWVREHRVPERCGPSQLAASLGWEVKSPVRVEVTPVEDLEVDASDDLEALAGILGNVDLWRRESSYLAVPKYPWLGIHQFRSTRGWESMFVPNGRGTVEWHLGFSVTVPDNHLLLVLPTDPPTEGLAVPWGVLTKKVLESVNERAGFSIAVRPTDTATINRGDPIARLLLLHSDSMTR